MATCFNDMKGEESFFRRTRKLSAQCLRQFEQQPEGKALFKSNLSRELGEMKENSFTIVQTMTAYLWSWLLTMVGHLFQNYDTIHVRFFPTYTCNHPCYDIRAFFATYSCVLSSFVGFLFPSIWPFSYKCAYICAQKKPIYKRYKQACVYGVTESRRIRGSELYRQQKTSSCMMELKSNFSLNQAWPQWPC